MPINNKTKKFLESSFSSKTKLYKLIAKLHGVDIEIDLHAFVLQASKEEMQTWIDIQEVFYLTKGQDKELIQIAETAKEEALVEKAFAEGRSYAFSLDPVSIEENSSLIRDSKNPYKDLSLYSLKIKLAWIDGFQNAVGVILGESW